jgi:hypothetical protein
MTTTWGTVCRALIDSRGAVAGAHDTLTIGVVVVRAQPVAGRACAVVIAAVCRAAESDLRAVLVLAKDLERGAFMVIEGTLVLRHIVELEHGDVLAELDRTITSLARDAALLATAVRHRRAPERAISLALDCYVD